MRAHWLCSLVPLLTCTAGLALASPWIAPGNEGLRNDIQLLADAGILHGPVMTWPMSWPDIARDANAADEADLDESTAAALFRVRRLSRSAAARGFGELGLRVSGSYDPTTLRSFADVPREEGEVEAQANWLSDHFALNLQGTVVADPDDGKKFRADGSYLGVNVGNFMISAGFVERWWGPGWDGSLILSTNARPIPGITLERNYTDPFKNKLLSWIGPWRASIAIGETDENDVAVSNVRFLAARVDFRPRSWIEFALSRTAQWCGEDRPCGWNTFADMLLGRDNQVGAGASLDDQPGNQMAGYDMKVRSPWKALPVAVYTQWIGEDEAGHLPSKFMGLLGLESWASTSFGTLRFRAEYTDTACMFTRQNPEFNCGYRNALYPQGYTYRGRVIGHAMDNDSRMYSLAALAARRNGDVLSVTVRRVQLNRDGAGTHAISEAPIHLSNVELRYSHAFGLGELDMGVGYENGGPAGGSAAISARDSSVHGFLSLHQGF
jgi:hypothetical protein